MKKKRIIPLVLFKDGYVVQARGFSNHKRLGLLGPTLTRLEEWGADEIIIANISSSGNGVAPTIGRTDLADEFQFDFFEAVRRYASLSSVPLTVGGGVRVVAEAERLFEIGADKVLINTGFHVNKSLVFDLSKNFGSQAIVLGVDYLEKLGAREVYIDRAGTPTGLNVSEVVECAESIGVGEFFLNSITRDGNKQGLDLTIMNLLVDTSTPVVLCGGVGQDSHVVEGLAALGVDGVAAANYFQHVENSVQLSRKSSLEAGIFVRRVDLTQQANG
jgi:cyclase